MANEKKAAAAAKAAGPADKGLRVVSKAEGFRRAGRAWAGTTVVPLSELKPEDVAALQAEPMLLVDEVDIEPAKAAA